MMIHDFDLVRFYLEKDEPLKLIASGSNISDKRFIKIKDYELASCIINSKSGVQVIITNSRHCSFGYDQRVELFGSKGMIISENKRENETSLYSSNSTSSKSPLLNFFIERYKDAYKNQLYDFSKFIKKNIRPLAEFEEGRRALIMANAAKKSISSKKFEKLTF
jgi:Predicted dehydrogenases and related proteins